MPQPSRASSTGLSAQESRRDGFFRPPTISRSPAPPTGIHCTHCPGGRQHVPGRAQPPRGAEANLCPDVRMLRRCPHSQASSGPTDSPMSIIADPTNTLLTEMIRATALRHRILATNLANVETPGYQAQEMTFSSALAEAGESNAQASNRPLPVQTLVGVDAQATPRRDGNTVDLDRQMVKKPSCSAHKPSASRPGKGCISRSCPN